MMELKEALRDGRPCRKHRILGGQTVQLKFARQKEVLFELAVPGA